MTTKQTFFKNWVLGAWIYGTNIESTKVFIRAAWIAVLFWLIAVITILAVKVLDTSFDDTFKSLRSGLTFRNMFTAASALFAAIWAVYTELRREFVSKFERLSKIHDEDIATNGILDYKCKKGDREFFIARDSTLNWLEDCLLYKMSRHESFKSTARYILGHLIYSRSNQFEHYKSEVKDCPQIRAHINSLARKGNLDVLRKIGQNLHVEACSDCLSVTNTCDFCEKKLRKSLRQFAGRT